MAAVLWDRHWDERLARRSDTVLVADGRVWTGRELVALADVLRRALEQAGLRLDDRVVLALPSGASLIAALVACTMNGAVIAPIAPELGIEIALDAVAADAVIASAPQDIAGIVWRDVAPGLALGTRARPQRDVTSADAALGRWVLSTSGSSGEPRWISCSDAAVESVLASHRAALGSGPARLLSALPWHHAFGLVLDLLLGLQDGALIVREASGGRDAASMVHTARAFDTTRLNAVPATITRLLGHPDGRALLAQCTSGIIGGAPITARLAASLQGTRLRVGYGQTEAAPGITLGAPGEFRERWIGRPLGCEVVSIEGRLHFRGANAPVGRWASGRFVANPNRSDWQDTGDVVSADADGWRFEGRASDDFKLSNGRWVAAAQLEAAIRASTGAEEALLWSIDGESINCAVTAPRSFDDDAVRRVLGSLASRVPRIHRVPATAWSRTPKGDVDRRRPPAVPGPTPVG
ncbi:MAG: class I adenylate-forming enzyme family protein [Gemmatimonadaceae bacterium]|nr:class I adenylate-forming enzyme family protein [Gemmatimonadaceae bacterium]